MGGKGRMGRPKHSSEKGEWEFSHSPFSLLCFGLPILPFPPITWSPHAINRITSFSYSSHLMQDKCKQSGEGCNESKGLTCCGGLRCKTGSGAHWGECSNLEETTPVENRNPAEVDVSPSEA